MLILWYWCVIINTYSFVCLALTRWVYFVWNYLNENFIKIENKTEQKQTSDSLNEDWLFRTSEYIFSVVTFICKLFTDSIDPLTMGFTLDGIRRRLVNRWTVLIIGCIQNVVSMTPMAIGATANDMKVLFNMTQEECKSVSYCL